MRTLEKVGGHSENEEMERIEWTFRNKKDEIQTQLECNIKQRQWWHFLPFASAITEGPKWAAAVTG